MDYKKEIERLKAALPVTIVAHYYQRDEVFNIADIVGDSLELARACQNDPNKWIIFCGVGFMGQSVKVISPEKRVLMPRVACCAMAKMLDDTYFDQSVSYVTERGIEKENILLAMEKYESQEFIDKEFEKYLFRQQNQDRKFWFYQENKGLQLDA